MRSDMTLGEVKALCAEKVAKYGDACCEHCEFSDCGCCNPPEDWDLEGEPCGQPNWEEMFRASEETCQQLSMKCEDAQFLARRYEEENCRLRTIVSVVETMIGRKFEWK